MRYLLMSVALLYSSLLFAGKPSEGAIYKGEDSISKAACTVVIKKIQKSFLVDNITTEITISGGTSREITFGEYDLSDGSYGRVYGHAPKIESFSLKVSDDKSKAEFKYDLLVPRSADIHKAKCMNLRLEDQSLDIIPSEAPQATDSEE